MKVVRIKLTKVGELEDALHPNNIPVGFEKVYNVHEDCFSPPCVGKRFNLGSFSTSGVQEVVNSDTFRTYSSIYRWKTLPNDSYDA